MSDSSRWDASTYEKCRKYKVCKSVKGVIFTLRKNRKINLQLTFHEKPL